MIGLARLAIGVLGGLLLVTFAGAAAAQTDLLARDTFSGFLDVRASASDGGRSWLDNGFGKLQPSGLTVDLAALAWRPQLADGLTGYVLVQNQPDQTHAVDLAEAYLQFKPLLDGPTHYSARAGLMWPPVSLEHDGTAWTTTRTLTASAINTWIAEEVKVAGIEGTIDERLGDHRLSATLGVFADNDTSGTLLSYRGWAMDDVRTTAFGEFPLPDGGPNANPRRQGYYAHPSLELDQRPGGYVKLEWRPPAPVVLNAFYYDNAGDPGVFTNGQWDWRTTFTNVGLVAHPGAGVEVLAQGMVGRTYFGVHGRTWYLDVDYHSAYVLATKAIDRQRFTIRLDWFDTQDRVHGSEDRDERGWGTTGDYAFSLSPTLSLWVEAMHVWSNRPSRARLFEAPTQAQNLLQIALRARL